MFTSKIDMAKILVKIINQRFCFGADCRLKKTAEFAQVFAAGSSAADAKLIVYGRANGGKQSRLGVLVGKKLGPAVQRNRYKRTLREAFRLSQHELPQGYDYVLIPRRTSEPSTRNYCESLKHLCRQIAKNKKRK